MRFKNLFSALFVLIALPAQVGHADPVNVFAAASTQQAVDDVVAQCTGVSNVECRVVYAASSTLARQIMSGAPADIYISANQKWMRYLNDNDRVVADTVRVVAKNHLVAIAPASARISIADTGALNAWLHQDRIVMGDPAHVPAGIYAKQALTSLGVWEQLQSKVLGMPNVRAALAVVARSEAGAGIAYATDALVTPDVVAVYKFADTTHDPIVYPMALVSGRDTKAARRVFELFASEVGRAAFQKAGFDVEVSQ